MLATVSIVSIVGSSTSSISFIFFFNDTSTTEIYTLSLHDALPISGAQDHGDVLGLLVARERARRLVAVHVGQDRKSTRLNSSHRCISYAVFCLKKKKKKSSISRTPTMPTFKHVNSPRIVYIPCIST